MNTISRRHFIFRLIPGLAAVPLAQWPFTPEPAPPALVSAVPLMQYPQPTPEVERDDTPEGISQRMAKMEIDSLVHYANEVTLFGFVHEHGRALIELYKRSPGPMYFWPSRPRQT